jgi:hypothetical protein
MGGWGRLTNLRCEAATICGGRPELFALANDADRGEPPSKILIRLNSMTEWIFGSDRPAFPLVQNETAAELGMVVAAEVCLKSPNGCRDR